MVILLAAPAVVATAAQVAGSYAEPQESYELEKITVSGRDYWVAKIEGEETFVIDDSDEILSGRDDIENLLIAHMRESVGIDEKTQLIKDYVDAFKQSQYPERSDCERITGVDKMECTDKESCLKACYAVPLCASQARDDLVESIRVWNALRGEVDENIDDAESKAGALNGDDESKYGSAANAISSMTEKMRQWEGSDIYSIPYCGNMSINYSAAETAESYAGEIAEALGGIDEINARAGEIYSNMNERMAYWENRSNMYKDAYGEVLAAYNEISSMYSKSGYVSSDVEASLKAAANYTGNMKQLKSEGKYRVAIDAGKDYLSELEKLKNKVKVYNVQYDAMKSKAEGVLESISKAKSKINETAYEQQLDSLENEIEDALEGKVNATEISDLSGRMDEIDGEVNNIIAKAVLEGGISGNNAVAENDVLGTVQGYLCAFISIIEQNAGISIDVLGVCGK